MRRRGTRSRSGRGARSCPLRVPAALAAVAEDDGVAAVVEHEVVVDAAHGAARPPALLDAPLVAEMCDGAPGDGGRGPGRVGADTHRAGLPETANIRSIHVRQHTSEPQRITHDFATIPRHPIRRSLTPIIG